MKHKYFADDNNNNSVLTQLKGTFQANNQTVIMAAARLPET